METQLIHGMKVAGLTLTTLNTVAPHTMPISLLTTCAALAVATTGGSSDPGTDTTTDPTTCIDDATTSQACLDQWVADF
jgi:hypothetical protein